MKWIPLLLLLLLITGAAYAQGGGYELAWWTVEGGGLTYSRADGFVLAGTLGQADSGVLQGGDFTVTGGFWSNSGSSPPDEPPAVKLYLPLVVRQ